MAVLVLVLAVVFGGLAAEAQVQHVVGGDQGWDPSSGVSHWSGDKLFRVGDRIWFAYSAAQGSVAEVRSREEYEDCNVSNPIKIYTDGLDNVSLDAQGTRFFTSTNSEHCNNGLKLKVEVLPMSYPGPGILQVTASEEHESIYPGPGIMQVIASEERESIAIATVADGPTTPSSSERIGASTVALVLFVASAFFGLVMGY